MFNLMQSKKILIVEDDPQIIKLITIHMCDLGFLVDSAVSGDAGFKMATSCRYDLMIIDVMLPGLNGFELCKKLRAEKIFIPLLMLTCCSEEVDRVLGLELGADDYLTKPFSIRELIARVKALVRRSSDWLNPTEQDDLRMLSSGDLSIDPNKRIVAQCGKNIDLTAKEFDLLYFLASNPGHVFTRAALLERIWDYHSSAYEHTVTSHINRLRNKIEIDPENPRFIMTVWGVGYRFAER